MSRTSGHLLEPTAWSSREVLFWDVSWPATKDELIVHAARTRAPLQLLEELFMLPDDGARYEARQLAPPPQGAA